MSRRRAGALNVPGRVPCAEPADRVIAAYGNGMPAILDRKVGRGRVIIFGCNVMDPATASNPHWQKVIRAMSGDLQLRLNQDIWRFQFPKEEADPPAPTDVCVTNNHVVWMENQPRTLYNADIGGATNTRVRPT